MGETGESMMVTVAFWVLIGLGLRYLFDQFKQH